MITNEEYKQIALDLLDRFYEVTKEHMAMSEAIRNYQPALNSAVLGFMPQATQAVDAAFQPLRISIEAGSEFRPALEALLRLP